MKQSISNIPTPIPPEIRNVVVQLLEPFAPGLTADTLAERITYKPEAGIERLLTRRETGSALRVSMPTVDRMLRANQLPKRRIRGAVRIPASAVERIISGRGESNV